MRKYESVEYIRHLGLPTAMCKEFVYSQQEQIGEYFDYVMDKVGKVGLRTDYGLNYPPNNIYNLPLFLNIKKDELLNFVHKNKNRYTYLICEDFYINEIIINGTVNILPGFNLYLAYNNLPEVPTCRHAIEDSRYAHGIKYISILFGQSVELIEWMGRLKEYVKRAWLRDGELIGKRIEFSICSNWNRFIFWQIMNDNLI